MSLSRIIQRQNEQKRDSKSPEAPCIHDEKETSSLESEILDNLVSQLIHNKLDKKIPIPSPDDKPLERKSNVRDLDGPESKHNYMFIADCGMTTPIKQQLKSYTNIRSFDNNFVNRSTLDLLQNGIEHIWVNIKNARARRWLELNLKPCVCYTKVLVWRGSKLNKFLSDVRPYIDIESKISNLNKLNALSLDELMGKLDDHIGIHSPANILAACFGCSKQVSSKKKN